MKELIHKMNDTSICIYSHNDEKIRGSFFKEKPEVGDIIMSFNKRETNYLRMFEVSEIIKNVDAKVRTDSRYDPKNALFILSIEEVTTDPRFSEVDNSLNRIK